jgi:hypothetical protein
MPSSQTAAAWLELACQALALANRMKDPEARHTMLEIAAKYERLATRAALAASRQSERASGDTGAGAG